jgi:hypothetical protein
VLSLVVGDHKRAKSALSIINNEVSFDYQSRSATVKSIASAIVGFLEEGVAGFSGDEILAYIIAIKCLTVSFYV